MTQIDDICIAPAIIDLFYFIICNVFSYTGHFYYVTITASFFYFLCANIENVAKSVYDFTHFTQVILKSIYICGHNYVGINRCVFIYLRQALPTQFPLQINAKFAYFLN